MWLSRNRLAGIWLCSAAIVTLVRVLNAPDPGEFPIAIQAAQHLVAGNGLTVFSSPGEDDVAQPAKLLTLAHFPTGFSLYAAALIAMGVGLGTLVQLFFAISTLLGWWGWANLAWEFFADGLQRRTRLWRWTAAAIAACTPLLYTIPWRSTDTFLWAAFPWALWLVVRGADPNEKRARLFDFLAGLLCGISFVMRYASVFLAAYLFIVIMCQSGTRLKLLAGRLGIFAAGLLPLVIPQWCFTHFASAPESISDIVTLNGGGAAILNRLREGLPFIPSLNITALWWAPHQVLGLFTRPRALWLIATTVMGWSLLPFIVARKLGYRDVGTAVRDVRVIASGLFLALSLFVLGWSSVAEYIYALEPRYYLPLIPLFVLVVYQLALPSGNDGSRFQRWISTGSRLYLAAYVLIAVIAVIRFLIPGEFGSASRVRLLGRKSYDVHWPSMKLTYEFYRGRAFVVSQMKARSDTVLVTDHAEWFYAESDIDRSRVRRLKDLEATYVSGPVRLLIVLQDRAPGPLWRVSWWGHYDHRWIADYFQDLPDVRLLREFPDEDIRVVEAVVPEGARVSLRKDTARIEDL